MMAQSGDDEDYSREQYYAQLDAEHDDYLESCNRSYSIRRMMVV